MGVGEGEGGAREGSQCKHCVLCVRARACERECVGERESERVRERESKSKREREIERVRARES